MVLIKRIEEENCSFSAGPWPETIHCAGVSVWACPERKCTPDNVTLAYFHGRLSLAARREDTPVESAHFAGGPAGSSPAGPEVTDGPAGGTGREKVDFRWVKG